MRQSTNTIQDGVSFIEFAIVLPLLLAVLAFVIDGSRLVQERVALDAFAREIARNGAGLPDLEVGTFSSSGSLPPVTAVLYLRADSLFKIGNTNGAISSNVYSLSTKNDGDVVEVRLSVEYSWLLGLQATFWNWGSSPAQITVTAQAPRLF